MPQKQLTRKSDQERVKEELGLRDLWSHSVAWGLIGIAVSLLATVLSVLASVKSTSRDFFSTVESLAYFVGGIFLLAFIIVGIASFMRRKNRDVILLKRRLAEIYLTALRRSALNPLTPHD